MMNGYFDIRKKKNKTLSKNYILFILQNILIIKYTLIVVLFFSTNSFAQKISTIEGNGKKLNVVDMTFMGRITWGGYEQIGKAAQSETDGAANTRAIVAAVGINSGYDGKIYAARVCDILTAGGFNDWYLPCKDQRDIIHLNFEKLKFDDRVTIRSSTEANGTQAVTKYFYSGAFYNVQKVDLCHLVCVRKPD